MSSSDYCAYLRKSRADRDAELRGEGETLARHKALLIECSEKAKMPISEFYCEVVTGDTIEERPQMQKLLSDVENGLWKGVWVVEVERLARGNTRDQGIVADTFKYSGTTIITPTKIYDPNNEFDEEYFEFGLFMSRREYKTINRRLQRGRIASVKEGKFVGSTAPYGYRKVKIPHDKGYTLEQVPDQADIVRQIFQWYCYGEQYPDGQRHRLGPDKIATRLDMLGIKPLNNSYWSKASISDMLRNEVYAGYIVFGRQKETKSSVNGKIVKIRKSNPDYLRVKGLHTPIIDEDTFELAAHLRKQNRKNTLPSSAVLQNPLSGLVYCKKCGKMMTRLGPNPRNRYATLKCPNRYCDNISSPMFLVEEQLMLFLQNWLNAYELNSKTITVVPLYQEIENKQNMIQKTEAEISGLQKQLEKAYDMLEQGVYTVDIFKNRRQILNDNIISLTDSIRDMRVSLDALEALRAERELFVPKVRNLLANYRDNDISTNNMILHEVIDKIYYQKDAPNHKGALRNANFSLEVFPKIPT